MPDRIDITAQTKVAELLEHYPELEKVLVEQAPMFAKIQNPVLRKTVARVATLERAAGMAGIPVNNILAALRREAGLPVQTVDESNQGDSPMHATGDSPDWVLKGTVKHEIDADKMLEGGEHPLGQMQELLQGMSEGELIRIDSSFPPIPLVEAMRKQGHLAYTGINASGAYQTFIQSGRD